MDPQKYQELSGDLLIRKNVYENKWKSYFITLSSTMIYASKSGKTEHKGNSDNKKRKIICDFNYTSACAEVSPMEYVAYRNDQPRPKIKRDFCFKISSTTTFGSYGQSLDTSRSIIYFAAQNEEERTRWIQAINKNIQIYKKTSDCIEKHNDLVRSLQLNYGVNWNALRLVDQVKADPITHSPAIPIADNTTNIIKDNKKSGISKKELEMKVMEQDLEIAQLKQRMEALERTVAELMKQQQQ